MLMENIHDGETGLIKVYAKSLFPNPAGNQIRTLQI